MTKKTKKYGLISSEDAQFTYTPREELFSALIHGIGLLLSTVMLSVLAVFAVKYGSMLSVITLTVFGVSMVIMFLTSTLYHSVTNGELKLKIKRLDHIVIYYLIAGTYTPFCLINLGGVNGWINFGVIWTLAIIGTISKLFQTSTKGTKPWSLGLYLLMGWLVIFSLPAFVRSVPTKGLLFVALGGLCYTVGTVFYVLKKMRYTHAIWHVFVLGGAIMHFFAVLYSCILQIE